MTKDFAFFGTKIFIRRLFKQDIDTIMDCYKSFDCLYFNPMTPTFASEVLLYGEIWGAFSNNKIVGCCYFFNAGSEFFKSYNAYEAIADFVDDMEKCTYLGYIYANEEYQSSGIYQAFYNVAQVQSLHKGAKYILHSVPVKLPHHLPPIFESGFKLIKLRGLDNLVVHYVFIKSLFLQDSLYSLDDKTTQLVSAANTKTLSKYLEHGYCGVAALQDENGATIQLKQLNNL